MEKTILGNRYELIERIGGGGMAIVYKARCMLLNRYVAVKILREEFINDEEFVKRFRVEAQAAASLSHPNIVSIFDVGQEEDIHYIVMEFIDGITLKDYINKRTRLDWEEAIQIALQICSAIEHAHKNNIIHRDIKPHNIMITQQGIAKVTDFGIARAVSSATITMVGSTIGSVHYFSPEQARGTITDEQSDLYSLGVTIYEMVTGKVPFNGESPVSVALKHIQEQPVPPAELVEDLPSGVNDIIMKAIMKEKERRYESATDLLADLHEIARQPDARFAIMPAINLAESPTKRMKAINGFDDYDGYTADEYNSKSYWSGNGNRNGNGNWGNNGDWDNDGEWDNDEDPEEAKKDKFSITLGVITGAAIVAILLYLAFKIFIPSLMANDEFVIKDYVGKVYEEVEAELASAGILSDAKLVYSDTVREGLIISQDPEKDKTLKPGSTMYFEVSNGPEMVTVPELFMRESRIAEQMLKDVGLVPEIITENHDTVPRGAVIRTHPEANRQVKPDSVVTIVESLGPKLKQVKVPHLLGRTRAEVEASLAANNLKIGKVIPEDIINDLAKVIEQYPAAGTTVDEGTAVDITYEIIQEETETDPEGPPEGPGEPTIKTQKWQVKLDDPSKYGDKIEVYIEATPSDSNKLIVVLNEKVSKSRFPLVVDIPMSAAGTTHVIVMYDGVIVAENDIAP
jgi:serine/threonine protein kinase/beta-lactam-binding protein with PASTA domain